MSRRQEDLDEESIESWRALSSKPQPEYHPQHSRQEQQEQQQQEIEQYQEDFHEQRAAAEAGDVANYPRIMGHHLMMMIDDDEEDDYDDEEEEDSDDDTSARPGAFNIAGNLPPSDGTVQYSMGGSSPRPTFRQNRLLIGGDEENLVVAELAPTTVEGVAIPMTNVQEQQQPRGSIGGNDHHDNDTRNSMGEDEDEGEEQPQQPATRNRTSNHSDQQHSAPQQLLHGFENTLVVAEVVDDAKNPSSKEEAEGAGFRFWKQAIVFFLAAIFIGIVVLIIVVVTVLPSQEQQQQLQENDEEVRTTTESPAMIANRPSPVSISQPSSFINIQNTTLPTINTTNKVPTPIPTTKPIPNPTTITTVSSTTMRPATPFPSQSPTSFPSSSPTTLPPTTNPTTESPTTQPTIASSSMPTFMPFISLAIQMVLPLFWVIQQELYGDF